MLCAQACWCRVLWGRARGAAWPGVCPPSAPPRPQKVRSHPGQPSRTPQSPAPGWAAGGRGAVGSYVGLTHSLVYAQIHTDTGGMQQAPAPLGHSYSISRLRKNSLSSFLVALVSVSLLETQPARLPAAGASPTALCLTPSSQGRAKVPLGEGTKGKKAPEKSPGQPPLLPTARNRHGALRDLKGFAMQ